MNARQLTILAVLAVVSVGATAAVLRSGTPTVAADRRGERVLPGLIAKANDITGLVVHQGADTLSIERRDKDFATTDSGFPVKADAVRDLVASSIELAFEEARTSDPARYGDLGLADPDSKEVVLRTAGGDLADFLVGNRDNTVGGPVGGVFVRLKGQPQTWLARGNVRLPASRSGWFADVDLDVKRNEIKQIELSGGGRDGVTATATAGKPGELTLKDVPEKRTAESFKVGRLANLVASFAFDDVRKRTKPADEARRMVVDLQGGLRLVVTSLGDKDGWVQIAAEGSDDTARDKAKAIAAKVDGFDFRLPANQAEVLGWTNADLTSEQKS